MISDDLSRSEKGEHGNINEPSENPRRKRTICEVQSNEDSVIREKKGNYYFAGELLPLDLQPPRESTSETKITPKGESEQNKSSHSSGRGARSENTAILKCGNKHEDETKKATSQIEYKDESISVSEILISDLQADVVEHLVQSLINLKDPGLLHKDEDGDT